MDNALVITDTSVLIAFEQIDRLDLLPGLFPYVIAPPAVVAEIAARPSWLHVVAVQDQTLVAEHRTLSLDVGEAEAIALAREHPGATLLLDERRGRRFARSLNLPVVGSVGILVRAKQAGLVSAVRPLLDALLHHGFFLSEAVYRRILEQAGELLS